MWMTRQEAIKKLKRYYAVTELCEELGYSVFSSVVLVGHTKKYVDSREARLVAQKVDLMESVRDVKEALEKLTDEQRLFAEMRYKREWGFRTIARALRRSIGSMPQYERDFLHAFIAALGKIPKEQ